MGVKKVNIVSHKGSTGEINIQACSVPKTLTSLTSCSLSPRYQPNMVARLSCTLNSTLSHVPLRTRQ